MEGARAKRPLLCGGFGRAAYAATAGIPGRLPRQRRKQAEIDIHGLERARTRINGLDMATGDVGKQRTMGGGVRWRNYIFAKTLCGREAAGQEPDRRGLDIALTAGDLSGEAKPRLRSQPQRSIQGFRRINERIAMQAAEPCKFGFGKSRNSPKDMQLLTMFQLGLKTHHIEERAEAVVLAELHDGVWFNLWTMQVCQPERFHRSVP